jgi:hypothetical protein
MVIRSRHGRQAVVCSFTGIQRRDATNTCTRRCASQHVPCFLVRFCNVASAVRTENSTTSTCCPESVTQTTETRCGSLRFQ